ncbi:MAG: hypothetical protein ACRDRR_12285 [Pseudonocardiaceae bacterium]
MRAPAWCPGRALLAELKADPGQVGLETLLREIDKLAAVRALGLPPGLFSDASEKLVEAWRARAARSYPSDLRAAPRPVRLTLLAALCTLRASEITDALVKLLIGLIHRINARADRRVERVHHRPARAGDHCTGRPGHGSGDGTAGGVAITIRRGEPWISVPKLTALPEPRNLAAVKDEVIRRWGTLDLLDVVKDADFLTEFSSEFTSVASREVIDRDTLRRRLLLCLFAAPTPWSWPRSVTWASATLRASAHVSGSLTLSLDFVRP